MLLGAPKPSHPENGGELLSWEERRGRELLLCVHFYDRCCSQHFTQMRSSSWPLCGYYLLVLWRRSWSLVQLSTKEVPHQWRRGRTTWIQDWPAAQPTLSLCWRKIKGLPTKPPTHMQYTFYLGKERMYCKFWNVEMASSGKRLRHCLLWRSIKPRLVIIRVWYNFSVVLPQGEKIDKMISQGLF